MKYIYLLIISLFIFNTSYSQMPTDDDAIRKNNYGFDRKKVKCSSFELSKEEQKLIADYKLRSDTNILPPDFPKPPRSAMPCGCHTFRNESFFISPMNVEEIFNYYSSLGTQKGYTFEAGISAGGPADYIMNFSGKKGNGSIYVYGDKRAYRLNFYPKKKCNCSKDRE